MKNINLYPQFAPLFIILMVLSSPLSSQIQKGTFSIDGEVGLFYQKYTAKTNDPSLDYKIGVANFTWQPIFRYFVNKNWLLGGVLGVNQSNYDSRVFSSKTFVVNSRYYVNPEAKWQIFGMADADLSHSKQFSKTPSYSLGLGGGVQHFFNTHIALVITGNYNFIRNNGSIIYPSIDGSIGFENFNLLTDNKNMTQLTSAKRLSIGGNIFISQINRKNNPNHPFLSKEVKWNISMNPNLAYFIASKTLLGLHVDYLPLESVTTIAARLYGRYYIPLSKRFYVFPQVSGFVSSVSGDEFGASAGIGLSYFLNKNVALETMFYDFKSSHINGFLHINSNIDASTQNHIVGPNIGLRYFLN